MTPELPPLEPALPEPTPQTPAEPSAPPRCRPRRPALISVLPPAPVRSRAHLLEWFGIAQALMKFTSEIGVLKGKFSYMSPEQIRGMPVDSRTDIFSAGIILHEMLTTEKLFGEAIARIHRADSLSSLFV